jgi:1-acyl-sn-glycerol-3-phosphate acyltransferase
VDLELDASLPGRQRLQHAAEQIRTTLGGHVHDASRRHGIPLPTDIPEGLIGT